MNIKCLIIDDEPPARKILKTYIDKVPFLSLSADCKNAFEAMEYLSNNKVDLILLDLLMPSLSGFDFLKSLSNPPPVIITSAFGEYALESYEYSVVDFLMKPISFDRFLKAINKLLKQQEEIPVEKKSNNEFMFLKADKTIHKVFYRDIRYIEANGNYLKIIMDAKKLIICETLISFLKKLPNDLFLRVHKSYIISKKHIISVYGNMIKMEGITIPIGRSYRTIVIENLDK